MLSAFLWRFFSLGTVRPDRNGFSYVFSSLMHIVFVLYGFGQLYLFPSSRAEDDSVSNEDR